MRAAITGFGAVTAFGRGVDRLWSAMAAGEPGIRTIERFSTADLDVKIAGVVPDRNDPAWHESGAAAARLCVDLAVTAAREALAAATLDVPPARLALVLGTSLGDYEQPMHEVTDEIADAIGARGPRITVSTACTSSTNALGFALDLLEQDLADAVIAGGADVLTPLVLGGFHRLGVLSKVPCAPFSSPPGTSLGEGAGFVVLERVERVERGARRARYDLLGYGLSADAYHETSPDPSGVGIARAMRTALAHADVAPDAIDYVNAHGTGTVAGDPAEWRALRSVLGARADRVPVSSSKSFLGHAQGAAGVVELIATLVAMDHGAIPPTRNFVGARPNSPPDAVGGDRPRQADVQHALCNSSGFGGANCAVAIGRSSIAPAIPRTPRPIYVAGIGVSGLAADAAPDVTKVAPWVDPRGLDTMTRHLVTAAALALADACVRVKAPMQERSGLVVGTTRVSKESSDALRKSIDERGLPYLAATMFSRMVLNAPVGACAKQLGLKGPLSTLSTGDLSGLAAIACAAHLLATRDDVDRIVTGGVEEDRRAPDPRTIAGSACTLLQLAPPRSDLGIQKPGPDLPFREPASMQPRIRLAGWAMAGPADRDVAIDRALAMAGVEDGPIARVEPELRGGAAASAHAFAAGVAALRNGARRVLVVGEPSASISVALVLVREPQDETAEQPADVAAS